MAAKLYDVVFVLGPPGSGKGTSCSLIQEKLKFLHLSAGDLLRAEREREGSQFGSLIEEHIRNGTIVPVEITCKLLENAMAASGDGSKFLIDGFPRNKDNLEGWQREMNSKGRSDDTKEVLRKRIEIYNTQTLPIIQYYQKLGLVREVHGENSIEKVYEDIEKIFNDFTN